MKKSTKRFSLLGILLLVASLGFFINPQLSYAAPAADGSTSGYIDTDWVGHTQPAHLQAGTHADRNPSASGLGLGAEMWMTKGGQKFDPVYCYNVERSLPSIGGLQTLYNRFGFFYGMENRATDLGSKEKVEAIAAVLYAGYPNDGLNGAFEADAQAAYNAFMADPALSTMVPSTYTIEQFKQDATQEAIWTIDNKLGGHAVEKFTAFLSDPSYSDPSGIAHSNATVAKYGQDLVNYALNHPLTEDLVDASKIAVVDKSGKAIDNTNKLVADTANGGFTQEFKVTGFYGMITITPDADWDLYDATSNTKVNQTQLTPGKLYKLKYVGKSAASGTSIDLKAQFKQLKDSYFFEPQAGSGVATDGKKWQNLVCLETTTASIAIPAVLDVKATTTDVKFNKFDATGSKELAGAHMQVIDKATGKVVDEWDSNASGVDHTFKAEEGKDYILRETAAPDGYEVIVDTTFVVNGGKVTTTGDSNVKVDGKDTTLVLINDQLKTASVEEKKDTTTDVIFSKTDVNGNAIEGAHLQIKDENGNVIYEWTSTTGNETFKLERGKTYFMHEDGAPYGYKLAADIKFRITSEGVVEVYNEQNGQWEKADDSIVRMIDEYAEGEKAAQTKQASDKKAAQKAQSLPKTADIFAAMPMVVSVLAILGIAFLFMAYRKKAQA